LLPTLVQREPLAIKGISKYTKQPNQNAQVRLINESNILMFLKFLKCSKTRIAFRLHIGKKTNAFFWKERIRTPKRLVLKKRIFPIIFIKFRKLKS